MGWDPSELAICIIHGNNEHYQGDLARRFSWPHLQLKQLQKHTPDGYKLYVYGNNLITEHADYLKNQIRVNYFSSEEVKHGRYYNVWPIRNWLARKAARNHKYILHLDSDAFPVSSDWLPVYLSKLSKATPVVAAQRLELSYSHSDRMFLLYNVESYRQFMFDFSPVGVDDPGGAISQEIERHGLVWHKLLRSNHFNYHPVLAGIYDNRIYHNGAGSRRPRWISTIKRFQKDSFYRKKETLLHEWIREKIFNETDHFIEQLRGNKPAQDTNQELLRLALKKRDLLLAWALMRYSKRVSKPQSIT